MSPLGRDWACAWLPLGGVIQHVQGKLEGLWLTASSSQPSHHTKASLLADTDECTEFPFVCPRDKPVCMNTYGGYRCRSNKRCGRGYEPNEDGTACVGE